MDSNMLALKWESFEHSYLEVLSSVHQTQAFSDATIVCDGKFYNVHKLVMSSCSNYLRMLFEKVNVCKSPLAHPVVILQGVPSRHMEALLDYMYLGKINILESELASLVQSAEILQIKGLGVPDKHIFSSCNENKRNTDDTNMPDIKKFRPVRFDAKESKNLLNSFGAKDVQELSKSEILSFKSKVEKHCEKMAPQSKSTPIDGKMSFDYPEYLSIKQELSVNQIKECCETKDSINENISLLVNHSQISEQDTSSYSKHEQEISYDNTEPSCSNVELKPNAENLNTLTPNKPDPSTSYISPGGPIEAIDLWLQLKTNKGPTVDVDCPLCTKHFKTKGDFLNHYKTHSDRPFACPHCKRRFVQRASLRNHIKTHTGERPFACPFCHRRFIQKKNLKNHIIAHVGKDCNA